jgi:hypothetical protein
MAVIPPPGKYDLWLDPDVNDFEVDETDLLQELKEGKRHLPVVRRLVPTHSRFLFFCFHLQPFRAIKGLAIVRLSG